MNAIFTNDELVGSDTAGLALTTREQLIAHLEADPRNAVLLESAGGHLVAITRDAGEEGFWWQELPLDEPDGTPTDTAAEAVDQAAGL